MTLQTIDQYCISNHITRRTFHRHQSDNKIQTIKIAGVTYAYCPKDIMQFTNEDKRVIIEAKKTEWNLRIREASLLKEAGTDVSKLIKLIFAEVKYFKSFGFNIKGYDLRSLQIKVKTGKTERKSRTEQKQFRNKTLREYPAALDKAIELLCSRKNGNDSFFDDANGSLRYALDRARMYAEKNEEYYEVAAINYYTLRRHVTKYFKHSGFRTIHEFINHYNLFRKKMPYAKGSFTNDIEFMDVWSFDDHKLDIAGVKVWDETSGEFKQKQLWGWFLIEAKSKFPLSWIIKAKDNFTEEDLVKLILKALKSWGKPNVKIICDNGLGKSQRVRDFCHKCGVVLELQEAYEPTNKATNERIYGFIKNETDCFELDFVGSNHPKEGRHYSLKLSPEETLTLENEAIKRVENYLMTTMIERPRETDTKDVEHLKDNTHRVSIRKVFDYYYTNHTRSEITDELLRYAYMKHDKIIKFRDGFYIEFKKEIYLPPMEQDISLVFFDPSYEYEAAYMPDDYNKIDLYLCQDIIDASTGELKLKGEKLCTMSSIMNLAADERKKVVAVTKKQFNKKALELAKIIRSKYSLDHPMVNRAVRADGTIENIYKEQEKAIAGVIKNTCSPDKIEIAITRAKEETMDIEQATSDESINRMNSIAVDD